MIKIREYFILLGILGAVFSSSLIFSFAHHDQYRYFQEDYGDPSFKKHCYNDSQNGSLRTLGRPLAAKLECTVFFHVSRLRDLTWVRVVALFGLALTCLILTQWLQSLGMGIWPSRLLSLGLMTLPGAQNAIFMGNLPNIVTPLFAISGGILAVRNAKHIDLFFAWLLVGLAFFTYSPMILLFFVPMVLALILDVRSWEPLWRMCGRVVAVFLAAAAVFFVFGRKKYLSDPAGMPEQYQLTLSPQLLKENLPRFYDQVLPIEFNGWDVNSEVFGFAIVGFLLLALFMPSKRRRGAAAVAILAFFAANILFLFTKAYILYRVAWAAMCILMTLAFGPALVSERNWLRYSAMAVLAGGLVLTVFNNHRNVMNSKLEFQYLQKSITAMPQNVSRVHILMPPANESFTGLRNVTGDEFNVLSTSFNPGFIVEMVKLAFLEAGRVGTVASVAQLPERIETFGEVELRGKSEDEYEILSGGKSVGSVRAGQRPKLFPWESRGEELSEERNVLNFYKLGQWRKLDPGGPSLAGRWKVENVSPMVYVSASLPDVEAPEGAFVINMNSEID